MRKTECIANSNNSVHVTHMNGRLQIDPRKGHGKPTFKGSRLLVSTVLGALGAGDSIETVLADYPELCRDDISAALEFASELSNYQTSPYDAVA